MTIQIKNWSGLSTDVSPHGQASEGSMSIARNVVHRKPGLLEPRQGLHFTDFSFITAARELHSFKGDILALFDNQAFWFSLNDDIANATGGADADPLEPWFNAVEMRGNVYFATVRGVQRLSAAADVAASYVTPSSIGYMEVATFVNESDNNLDWLIDDGAVAYRVVIRRIDENGVITLSRPAPRLLCWNVSGGARRPRISVTTSNTNETVARNGDIIELYRTRTVGPITVADDVPRSVPNLYFFAGSQPFVSGTGVYTFQDTTRPDELGQALYTNSGAAQGNIVPPVARVLNTYQGSLFLANMTSLRYLVIGAFYSLTPSGGTATVPGRQDYASTSFTNGSNTFTAPVGHIIQIGQRIVSATAYPSSNVTLVINVVGNTITTDNNAAATVSQIFEAHDRIYLYSNGVVISSATLTNANSYASFFGLNSATIRISPINDTLPFDGTAIGTFLHLEEVRAGGNQLAVAMTHGNLANPVIARFDSGNRTELVSDQLPNGILWSNFQEPESFQPVNFRFLGDGAAIEAMVSVGNRQYIFFEDASIFVCQGESARSGFRFDRMNGKYRLISPRHLCNFGEAQERAAAWTDQGLIIIDEMGSIQNVSDFRITELLSQYKVGVTEGNLRYDTVTNEILFTANSVDAGAVCLRYNVLTSFWSTVDINDNGRVPDLIARLPMAANQGGGVAFWRDAETDLWHTPPPHSDLFGREFEYYSELGNTATWATVVVTSLGNSLYGLVGTWGVRLGNILVGDLVYDSANNEIGVVTTLNSQDATNFNVVAYSETGFSATPDRVYRGIIASMELLAQADQDISSWKRWDEVEFSFEPGSQIYNPTLYVKSSNSDTPQSVSGGPLQIVAGGGLDGRPRIICNPDHMQSLTLRAGMSIAEATRWKLAAITYNSRVEGRRYKP